MSVREARKRKGWTQLDLAKHANVSRGTIIHVENGHSVRPVVKRAICQALGTDDIEFVVPNKEDDTAK